MRPRAHAPVRPCCRLLHRGGLRFYAERLGRQGALAVRALPQFDRGQPAEPLHGVEPCMSVVASLSSHHTSSSIQAGARSPPAPMPSSLPTPSTDFRRAIVRADALSAGAHRGQSNPRDTHTIHSASAPHRVRGAVPRPHRSPLTRAACSRHNSGSRGPAAGSARSRLAPAGPHLRYAHLIGVFLSTQFGPFGGASRPAAPFPVLRWGNMAEHEALCVLLLQISCQREGGEADFP